LSKTTARASPRTRRILVDGDAAAPERSDGLGLWLVNWGVRQAGGAIDYAAENGSVVTLRVPKRDADAD
jgi:two-component sensor histidine kinase